MKRVLSFVMVLVVLLSFSVTAIAAEGDFVPSIGEKPAPEIYDYVVLTADGEFICNEHDDCIVVTSISEIDDAELPEETKKQLKDIYEKIKDAEDLSEVFSGLADPDKKVVRDLFDISSICDGLDDEIQEDQSNINITFKVNIDDKTPLTAMVLVNGVWQQVNLTNNNDGTVTGEFSDIGPVAFLTDAAAVGNSPDTGDNTDLALWITLLAVSLTAIAVLVVIILRKRSTEK